jgi:hypothetical protein
MSPCQTKSPRSAIKKALLGLIGVAGCLGAAAYASAPHQPADPDAAAKPAFRPGAGSIPAPDISQHPDKAATSTTARFSFTIRLPRPRFHCRLDARGWRACQAPVVFAELAVGRHRFFVRALDRRGRRGPASRFRWRLLEPKDFSIQPQMARLGPLYPGAPPVALPLVIANPNEVPIFITSLQATATANPQGCTSAENLALTQSSLSSSAPLKVPAGKSVSLPAPGISPPAIQLRNLPVNQDACQNARFPLAFAGKARG